MNIKQKEPKPYDCWLHWYVSNRCNMDCAYCTLGPIKKTAKIPSIDIPSLISVLESTHKTFKIGFTGGGEPFLVPNLVEACIEITKKHYLSFNTNLTSKNIIEFANKIDPTRVMHITASLHIKELERSGLLGVYIDNFVLLKKRGFNLIANEVAHPTVLEDIQKYTEFFLKKDIKLRFAPFIGEHKGKSYPDSYTEKESEAFGFRKKRLSIFHNKGKLCNAGYNVGIIDPRGNIYPCESLKERIGNVYNKIEFKKNLIVCPFKFCGCPLNAYDSYLFTKSVREADTPPRKINPFFMLFNSLKTKQINLIQKFL